MSFFKTVEKRRSIRSFSNRSVEKSKIQKILKSPWMSPSAKGLQNYQIFVIEDQKKKEKLVNATYGQEYVNSSLVLVFCSNPKRIKFMGSRGKNITEHIRKMPKICSTKTLTRSESEEFFQSPEKLIGVILGQNLAQAYVVIHCHRGEEYSTLKNLSHIPEVKEVDVVFGFYDVICKIVAPDNQTLENITTKAIRKLPNIESSMTLNIINEQDSS